MSAPELVLKGLQAFVDTTVAFSHEQRVSYLKQYGVHSQAFTTLQPDLSYFDVQGMGYVAYTKKWGISIAFSDPVCHPDNFEIMLDMFLRAHPGAMFCQVSKPVVDLLHNKYHFYGTQMGSESKVYLNDWSLSGSSKKSIRQAVNQAREQGIDVREGQMDPATKAVSDKWIKTRACKREIRFLIRPMEMSYRENVRYFYAYKDGQPVGFAWFDPCYRDGKIVGYIPNISRACEEFKQGIWYALMVHAMNVFKEEGVEYLDLGLIPLAGLDEPIESQEDGALRFIMKQIYKYGCRLYNFKGLEFTKARFKGVYSRTYVAHSNRLPLLSLIATFRMTRLI